jgi:hypothetical protein
VMSASPHTRLDGIASDLAVPATNASAQLRLGEAVEGPHAANELMIMNFEMNSGRSKARRGGEAPSTASRSPSPACCAAGGGSKA